MDDVMQNIGQEEGPRVFIGSSQEGRSIANYIHLGLHQEGVDWEVWSDGVFQLSENTLDSLARATREVDFAILVLTPDDSSEKRGKPSSALRDSIILELGMFLGTLGSNRTLVVKPSNEQIDLPTDLAGVRVATYVPGKDENLRAVLGPVCVQLKEAIERTHSVSSRRATGASDAQSKQWVARSRRRRSLGKAYDPSESFYIVNLSVTGAFLETREELRVGKVLDLVLDLENGKQARVSAKVVRVQRPDWGVVGGAGIEFIECPEQSQRIIEDYVNAGLAVDSTLPSLKP